MKELDDIAMNLEGAELNTAAIASCNIARPIHELFMQYQTTASASMHYCAGYLFGLAQMVKKKDDILSMKKDDKYQLVSTGLHAVMNIIDNDAYIELNLDTKLRQRSFAFLGEMAGLSPEECGGEAPDETGVTEKRFTGQNIIKMTDRKRK